MSLDQNKLARPLAAYSHTRTVGSLVFIAGQGCRDPETNIWAGVEFGPDGKATRIDFEAQVRGVFRNVERALASAGLGKSDLVDIQVFLTDMNAQFQVMNHVWNEFFADVSAPPTRTTVAVRELPGLNLIEMKPIAARTGQT